MMRYFLGTAAVAALLAVPTLSTPTFAQAVAGYEAPNYEMLCTNGVRKLDLGIEVIGASPAQIQRARALAERARASAQKTDYYNCADAARAGLNALDAG
jgi:hypothetical protein